MKKSMIALMIGVSVLTFAGCNSDKPKTDIGTPLVIERETTTTTTSESVDSEKLSTCIELTSSVSEGFDAMNDGVDGLPYVSDADALDFLATAKDFIANAKTVAEFCAEFGTSNAADLLSSLEELDDTTDALIATYEYQ